MSLELFIVFMALCACVGSIGYSIYERRKERRTRPQYILYLLKVSEDGKIEIKQSPKNEIWNWRF